MRVQKLNHTGMEAYVFECPARGCGHHMIPVAYTDEYRAQCKAAGRNGAQWEWNGNVDRPTFNPSLLVREYGPNDEVVRVCHSYVKEGRIEFLSDCTHELAGKVVDLPEVD